MRLISLFKTEKLVNRAFMQQSSVLPVWQSFFWAFFDIRKNSPPYPVGIRFCLISHPSRKIFLPSGINRVQPLGKKAAWCLCLFESRLEECSYLLFRIVITWIKNYLLINLSLSPIPRFNRLTNSFFSALLQKISIYFIMYF